MVETVEVTSDMLKAGHEAKSRLYEGDYSGRIEFQDAKLEAAYRAMRNKEKLNV